MESKQRIDLSEWSKGQPSSTSLEGSVINCEFESYHYEEVVEYFKNTTILLQFLGRPPNIDDLHKCLKEIWSDRGWNIDRIGYLWKGYFVVIFGDGVVLEEVLQEGPWSFRGGLGLVQPWVPEFSMGHGSYGIHPAWVELCNLPIYLWHVTIRFFKSISKVIKFDESQRFTIHPHARACVLVDTNKELPKTMVVRIGGNVVHEIKIMVLGLPHACLCCKKLGHLIKYWPYKPSPLKKFLH